MLVNDNMQQVKCAKVVSCLGRSLQPAALMDMDC